MIITAGTAHLMARVIALKQIVNKTAYRRQIVIHILSISVQLMSRPILIVNHVKTHVNSHRNV